MGWKKNKRFRTEKKNTKKPINKKLNINKE